MTFPSYFVVADTNPTTQVWESATGQMVANNSAAYQSWVANGGSRSSVSGQIHVTGATNNGSGLIRLTVDDASVMVSNDVWVVQNVGGTTEANGTWALTAVDATHVDLQGSAFVHAFTSSGVIDRGVPIDTMANLLIALDNSNQNLKPSPYLAVSSGVNFQMTNTPPLVFDFTPTVGGLSVKLPQANIPTSIAKGRPLLIHNASNSSSFLLADFNGADILASGNFPPNGFLTLMLTDNSTKQGTFENYFSLQVNLVVIGNSDAFILASGAVVNTYVTGTALTAPRTWNLPAAIDCIQGTLVLVADQGGVVTSVNTIAVARAGSDTINGSASSIVLNRAHDWVLLETDAVSRWTIVGGKGALAVSDLSDVPSANTVLAGPTSGGAATATFRALVGADLPNPSSTTLGGVESLASASHKWINAISTSGVPSATQPDFTDISGTIAVAQATVAVQTVKKQVFTASGTYTPSAGMLYCIIECVGGGGGGAGAVGSAGGISSGGGGGAGSYARKIASASDIGSSKTATIGAGGNGGAAGADGSDGNDTSVGILCIGKAGSHGVQLGANLAGTGGSGGVAGTGDFTPVGASGFAGIGASILTVNGPGGDGGNGPWGGAPKYVITAGGVRNGSNAAANTGAGGQGGATNGSGAGVNATGGNGGSGVVIITEFCNQ